MEYAKTEMPVYKPILTWERRTKIESSHADYLGTSMFTH